MMRAIGNPPNERNFQITSDQGKGWLINIQSCDSDFAYVDTPSYFTIPFQVIFSANELGTMSKNNLRGITFSIMLTWEINSNTLHTLLINYFNIAFLALLTFQRLCSHNK